MGKPIFTGLSHVCIFVDDVKEAFAYYERILGAVPNQHIPHWKNEGFFQAGGFIEEAKEAEVSIGFMDVPGTKFTIELMCYHKPEGRKEPIIFKANDISGARHVALKVTNIEEAFAYIKAQPDVTLINTITGYTRSARQNLRIFIILTRRRKTMRRRSRRRLTFLETPSIFISSTSMVCSGSLSRDTRISGTDPA